MTHSVTFTLPARELGRADATFHVRVDDELLGTLEVSNGSIVWFPRDTTYGHKMAWSAFDTLMRANAPGRERRRKKNAG